MPGSFKTEAIVLRSIRYGEADRVLHLYTADRGRVGAVAKIAQGERGKPVHLKPKSYLAATARPRREPAFGTKA